MRSRFGAGIPDFDLGHFKVVLTSEPPQVEMLRKVNT